MSEDLGKIIQIEIPGTLVYPRKMKLKDLVKIFNYGVGIVVLNDGTEHKAPLKARWVNKRYGKFKIFVDISRFKKVKRSYIKIE